MHSEFPKLLIECPSDLRVQFPLRDCDWEMFGGTNCLKFLISPDEYTPIVNFPNGEPEYLRSLSLPQYALRSYAGGIELRITDERDRLFYLIQALATRSTSNQFKREIRLFDFVLPEVEDVATGYTMRIGVFKPPKAQGGRVMLGNSGFIKGGFTVSFEEKRLRLR